MLKVDVVTTLTMADACRQMLEERPVWPREWYYGIFLVEADNLAQLALLVGRSSVRVTPEQMFHCWAELEPILQSAVTEGRLEWLGAEPTLERLNQALANHGLPTIPQGVVDVCCGDLPHVECLDYYYNQLQVPTA